MPPGILVFTLKQVVYAWTGKLQLQSPKVARLHLSEVVKHIHMKVLLQSTHTLKQPIYWYNKSGCRYSSAGHTAHLNIQIFFTAWPEAATIHNTNNDFIIFAIEQITNKRWDGKLKSRKKIVIMKKYKLHRNKHFLILHSSYPQNSEKFTTIQLCISKWTNPGKTA